MNSPLATLDFCLHSLHSIATTRIAELWTRHFVRRKNRSSWHLGWNFGYRFPSRFYIHAEGFIRTKLNGMRWYWFWWRWVHWHSPLATGVSKNHSTGFTFPLHRYIPLPVLDISRLTTVLVYWLGCLSDRITFIQVVEIYYLTVPASSLLFSQRPCLILIFQSILLRRCQANNFIFRYFLLH